MLNITIIIIPDVSHTEEVIIYNIVHKIYLGEFYSLLDLRKHIQIVSH